MGSLKSDLLNAHIEMSIIPKLSQEIDAGYQFGIVKIRPV